jgi:hypothetical protein
MTEQTLPTIDYHVWLMSDWAYLGGVRFVQMPRVTTLASTTSRRACKTYTPEAGACC